MMDMPPEPPPALEQIIEQRLVDCGLGKSGFTVKYEDYLRSIEIVISPAAGATKDQFACIREATGNEIVTFADGAMYMAYLDFVSELVRPQVLETARSELEKRGLLAGFPKRESFDNLDRYAEALEVHSGLKSRSALRVEGDSIAFDPSVKDQNFDAFSKKYANLFAVINFAIARGDFKNFGFIGNEAVAEDKHQ
jgi:hypothetical protein